MWSEIGAGYLPVVQTGLQTLSVIALGRLAATRGLFGDPAPACRTLNRFVMVVCLPALQFWLLAIKTDMRNMEHWRAVGAFMMWTVLVQLACAAWVLAFEGGKMSRIAVHSLVLVANNTGILAPVVLEAAVGPAAAAVGMLATIALYFQQLPVAMVLFELDRMGSGHGNDAEDGAEAAAGAITSPAPTQNVRQQGGAQSAAAEAVVGKRAPGELSPSPSRSRSAEKPPSAFGKRSFGSSGELLLRSPSQLQRPGSFREEDGEEEEGEEGRELPSSSAALPLRPRERSGEAPIAQDWEQGPPPRAGGGWRSRRSTAQGSGGGAWSSLSPRQSAADPTAAAVAAASGVDATRAHSPARRQLLRSTTPHSPPPASPTPPPPPPLLLPFAHGRLLSDSGAGGAGCGGGGGAGAGAGEEPGLRHAVQLVMGNTLMWTTGAATAVSMMGLHNLLDPAVPTHAAALGFVEGTLSWLARCSVPVSLFAMGLWTASRAGSGLFGGSVRPAWAAYLAIKLLGLPWLMVFVNSVLGLGGRLGRSLVVLTCVPVGQNAFLVTEQYGEGAREVTQVMQVGLLLMLPHVAAVMAALRWMGLYEEDGSGSGAK